MKSSPLGFRLVTLFSPLTALACAAVLTAGAIRACAPGLARGMGDGKGWALLDGVLLARTLGVALAIGVVATLLGLGAAWCMRWVSDRWLAFLIAPLLLPSYLVYAAWGTLRGPGSTLGNWIGRNASPEMLATIDGAQAIGGLALWAWPLSALIVGTSARRIDGATMDALALSGAGAWRRLMVLLSLLRGPLLASVAVVGVIMLGSAIPLHVARVPTYAIVVWRALDETAGSAAAWRASVPLALPAVVMGWIVGGRLLSRRSGVAQPGVDAARRSRLAEFAAAGVWLLSAGVPLALLVAALREWSSIGGFFETAGASLVTSGKSAIAMGLVALGVGVSTAMAQGDGRSGAIARLGFRVWLALAFVPGILVGSAVVSAGRLSGMAWLTAGDAGVVLAHVARFGGVAALAGWWCARSEPEELADVRRLNPRPVMAWLSGPGRMGAALLAGSAVMTALLSLHEIEAAVVASPPRTITEGGTLAEHMLRLLHFNRDEELTAASIVLMTGGLVAGLVCMLMTRKSLRGPGWRAAALAIAVVVIGGCERPPTAAEPLRVTTMFGEPGRAAGQFVVPRAIDSDGRTLWVVDKSGHVQHLDADGAFLGRSELDRHDKGFPCGITCGPDGLIYIADTHENRVSVWRPEPGGAATMVGAWGSYGTEAGEFIYPTDVAIVPAADGKTPERIYVAEYGGNDRISVFDAQHQFLFTFGQVSEADPGGLFRRPQSIAYDPASKRLVVNDAVNHRVGVFELDGSLVRWIGKIGGGPGNGLGEFAYPYGLALLEDGRALVSEFGNNRVQLVDVEQGVGVAIYGESGRGAGQLVTPWGVAVLGGTAYVLDTGNARVLGFRSPGRSATAMLGGHE